MLKDAWISPCIESTARVVARRQQHVTMMFQVDARTEFTRELEAFRREEVAVLAASAG